MSITDNCEFIDRFYERIELLDADFVGRTSIDEIDSTLLNSITVSLNRKIKETIETRNDVIATKIIPIDLKRTFRDTYIRPAIFRNYDRTVVKMSDLFQFTLDANIFPTRQRVIDEMDKLNQTFYISFAQTYPFISRRIRSSNITATEVSLLIQRSGVDPNAINRVLDQTPSSVFDLLERFLSRLGSGISQLSNICGLIENVYALMAGQVDSLGNLAQLGSEIQFQEILGRINPRLQLITGQIEQIRSMITDVLDTSKTMEDRMKNAFDLIAASQGIILSFFNRASGSAGGIKVDWNLQAIKESIEDIVNDIQSPFLQETADGIIIVDFDRDGFVSNTDVSIFQTYIDYVDAIEQEIPFDDSVLDAFDDITLEILLERVEVVLFGYMIDNIDDFKDFVNTGSLQVDTSQSIKLFGEVSGIFGNPSNPSAGDFGQSELQNMLNVVSSLDGSVGNLIGELQAISRTFQTGIGGFSMINIQGLIGNIQELQSSAQSVVTQIFGDQKDLMEKFKETTTEALKEAEKLATTNPTRTRAISEARGEALKEDIARVTALVGTSTSKLIGALPRQLQALTKQLEGAAAVGIIEHIDKQMQDRIKTAAQRLKSATSLINIESISSSGFDVNMQSAFARMAGLLADAKAASSEEGIEKLTAATRGILKVQTERTLDIRRPQAEFVALRFCRLANEIDRIFDTFLEPAQQMIGQFRSADIVFGATSGETLRGVLTAGGIRLNKDARIAAARTAGTSIPATVSRPNIDPATGLRTTVPPGGTIPSGLDTIPPAAFNGLPRYDDVFQKTWEGLLIFAPVGPRSIALGRRSWDRLRPELLSRLVSLAKEWKNQGNGAIRVNSAVRDQNSGYHPLGMAVDINMPTPQDQLLFANLAYRAGFRGIGSYRTFIHIDIGPQRSWAGGDTSRFGYFDYVNNRFPRYGNRTVQFNLSGSLGSRSFI